ncbi:uncharacterized protein LOC142172447 [Nicotiana tabacum]|uniref:Uncharacterized protein LOC142172447 n=1 Tax=Nicotiana tabacum TaxID=4097 RepID=A0AC58T4K2_TOBAC
MKSLNRAEYNAIGDKIQRCRQHLSELHEQMRDPGQPEDVIIDEKNTKAQLEKWLGVEESIMKQKSRDTLVEIRYSQNKIKSLIRDNGEMVQTKQEIEEEVLGFYKKLLGSSARNLPGINPMALLGINDNKAPGCDGFNALFFKKAWSVIGDKVTEAVMEFFTNDQLCQPINCTTSHLCQRLQGIMNDIVDRN